MKDFTAFRPALHSGDKNNANDQAVLEQNCYFLTYNSELKAANYLLPFNQYLLLKHKMNRSRNNF